MGKHFKRYFFIAAVCAVLVCGGLGCILKYQEEVIVELEDQIQYLEEDFTPLKFEITEKNAGSMLVKIKFYDITGKECGNTEVNLKGEELNFDVETVQFSNGSYLFFPKGVYTSSMKIADEVLVCSVYGNEGFPLIYRGMEMRNKDGKALDRQGEEQVNTQLSSLYGSVCNGLAISSTENHGVSVHELLSISEFKKGCVYRIMCHPAKGGIEIVRDR